MAGAFRATFPLLALIGMTSALTAEAAAADVRRDAVVEAVERVMPSIVNVSTRTQVRRQGYFYDWWRDNWAPFFQELPPQYSAGSGVIIDESGYVLTNGHVVQGADEIWVTMSDGSEHRATVIKAKPKTDVALLKLNAKSGEKFQAVALAADEDLLLGETVLALGNPFGLGVSVSRGILSSKNRRPAPDNEPQMQIADWLQTDAAINPGNSGGPLINLRGEVIGINVAIYRPGQGIGFAIPVKAVSQALAEIYTPEELASLWFGARVRPGPPPLEILSVDPQSPAQKAGLQAGDRILEVEGKPPKSFIEFSQALVAVGDKRPVVLLIQRAQERKKVSIQQVPEGHFFNAELIRQKLGASVQPLKEDLADSLGLNTTEGLVISGVDAQGPAAEAGLQQRVVIQAIDGQPITDVVQAAKILYGHKPGDQVTLSVVVERSNQFFIQKRTGTVAVKVR